MGKVLSHFTFKVFSRFLVFFAALLLECRLFNAEAQRAFGPPRRIYPRPVTALTIVVAEEVCGVSHVSAAESLRNRPEAAL